MIRSAGLGDINGILTLLREFHRESGWDRWFGWSRLSVASFVRGLRDGGALVVAEIDGRLVGVAGAHIAPHQFNAEVTVAQEMFWYVAPQHRKGVGRELLAGLESRAKELGADLFVMACIEDRRSEALSRFYRAAGFSPSERTFIKRV